MKNIKKQITGLIVATLLCGSCANPLESDSNNIINSILDKISDYLSDSNYSSDEISSIEQEISSILESSPEQESSNNYLDSLSITSIANALKIAQKLDNGASTNTKYYLKGKVVDLSNTIYGNCYLQDNDGNKIQIYGSYSFDGSKRYDSMSNKFKDGDEVIFYGILKNYFNENTSTNYYEMENAWTIGINGVYQGNNTDGPNDSDSSNPSDNENFVDTLDLTSISDIISIASSLANGETSKEKYYVLGNVTDLYNTTYGNCYLQDNDGNKIQIYGSYSFDGSKRYDSMSNKFVEGDEVVFYGPVMNYYDSQKQVNKYELVNAWTIAINGVDQSKAAPNPIDPNPITPDNPIYPSEDGWTNTDMKDYYSGISLKETGDTLLSSLRTLNNKMRKKTVGYSGLWTYYSQTDYDPNNKNQYLAFYQGVGGSKSEMNKEHVWPKSRGGNLVDGDLHMTRPTFTKDNSSRGHSFYVEGRNHSSSGWDPKAAGMKEQYRGQAARIIFYCVVASNQLSLVDKDNDATSNKTMGKLSDLLKWNLEYDVVQSELNRNNGAQNVQGNRNPFIDNPGMACAIWGNTNTTTKSICAGK